jgi:hypothetical protein
MAGALLGLLRYNIHPALTFLGDSGSLLLGFTLAVVSILQSAKTSTFLVLVVPVLLLAIPMVDTVFAFFRRGIRGQNPFKADREHLHHQLLALNFTTKQTLGLFFSLSAGLGVLALWLAQTRQLQVFAVGVLLLLAMLAFTKAMQIFNFHDLVLSTNRRMKAIARQAVGRKKDEGEFLSRYVIVLAMLLLFNLFLMVRGGRLIPPLVAASVLLFMTGSLDVVLNKFGGEEVRYGVLHVTLLLSLILNKITIIATWPMSYLVAPQSGVPSLILLIIIPWFLFRSGTFAVFLGDPMEVLGLFMGVAAAGLAKHFLNVPAVLPFIAALMNALVIYILLKVFLTGYRLRTWVHSAGFAACIVLLISVGWWV